MSNLTLVSKSNTGNAPISSPVVYATGNRVFVHHIVTFLNYEPGAAALSKTFREAMQDKRIVFLWDTRNQLRNVIQLDAAKNLLQQLLDEGFSIESRRMHNHKQIAAARARVASIAHTIQTTRRPEADSDEHERSFIESAQTEMAQYRAQIDFYEKLQDKDNKLRVLCDQAINDAGIQIADLYGKVGVCVIPDAPAKLKSIHVLLYPQAPQELLDDLQKPKPLALETIVNNRRLEKRGRLEAQVQAQRKKIEELRKLLDKFTTGKADYFQVREAHIQASIDERIQRLADRAEETTPDSDPVIAGWKKRLAQVAVEKNMCMGFQKEIEERQAALAKTEAELNRINALLAQANAAAPGQDKAGSKRSP